MRSSCHNLIRLRHWWKKLPKNAKKGHSKSIHTGVENALI